MPRAEPGPLTGQRPPEQRQGPFRVPVPLPQEGQVVESRERGGVRWAEPAVIAVHRLLRERERAGGGGAVGWTNGIGSVMDEEASVSEAEAEANVEWIRGRQ